MERFEIISSLLWELDFSKKLQIICTISEFRNIEL